MPDYMRNKPVDVLIGPGLGAEDFNDDGLGRSLDALHARGVTEVFAQVAARALRVYGIEHRFVHVDSSSFHPRGQHEEGEPNCPLALHWLCFRLQPSLQSASPAGCLVLS